MLKNILLTAFRNVTRYRSFSIINLIGLSVSMSLGLLIILIIQEQYTYDNFHPNADRIYRVDTKAIRKNGSTEPYASAPLPLGQVLRDNYTFTEKVARIDRQLHTDANFESVSVPVSGFFTDPSFLEIFHFPLANGDAVTALNEPNSLVLTQAAAKKILGEENPMGKVITLGKYGEFKVTGVLEEFPGPTHFDFEILTSTSLLPLLEKQNKIPPRLDNWNNYYSGYVYFMLQKGANEKEIATALSDIAKEQYANLELETRDKGYEFFIQPLSEITPGPILSNQMGSGMPELLLVILGVLAGIVMVMACFNYTNMTIALSLARAKEIGIRKINGASRWQVFLQFVGESVVFAMVALIFSYILLQLIRPIFLQLHLSQEFSIHLEENHVVYIAFLLFAIGIGIIAGLLPSFYLSAYKPLKVLMGVGNIKVYSRLTLRKVLMVTQFALSVIFIIFVLVIHKQIQFVLNANYGFNDKNIINIRLKHVDFEKFAHEVSTLAGVNAVGGVSHSLGTWADRSDDYKRKPEDETFVMRDFLVDEHYLANLEVPFIAGKNFEAYAGSQEKFIILNETALPKLGFEDAPSALGQAVIVSDTLNLQVIGVIKDFHFRPLNYAIGPVAFRYQPDGINILSAKVNTTDMDTLVASIATLWKKYEPVHPMEWQTMEDEIDRAYSDSGFKDVLAIVGYIALVAVSLACLGMLGMAMYTTRTRVKEIGIRKVMGARAMDITLLLSRSFLLLIGIAVVIGTPLSYLLSDLFLSSYAYKITITPGLMILGIASLILLGIVTICTQTMAAALRNPVESLRYE